MDFEPHTFIPTEVVFTPRWWNRNYGIDFSEDFFFDAQKRIEAEQKMEQALHERFGPIVASEAEPPLRPIIGPVHLAAGFLVPAVFGCEIRYASDASPQVVPMNMSLDKAVRMQPPDLAVNPVWKRFTNMVETLERRFGYVEGDFCWHTLQNLGLDLMGQDLFIHYLTEPVKVKKVYEKLNETVLEMLDYVRSRTNNSSISVNRNVRHVDPSLNLNSNCSVQMISNELYEQMLLPFENRLSRRLQPYGVHHCGNNMDNVARGYSKIENCCFFDVGWGSDIQACRAALPEAFFNLRLSPVELMNYTRARVRQTILDLAGKAGAREKIGICCINIDYGTPDENVMEIFDTATVLRSEGA